jgi:hypothetical protein
VEALLLPCPEHELAEAACALPRDGALSLEAWISHWVAVTLKTPAAAFRLLAYLGYALPTPPLLLLAPPAPRRVLLAVLQAVPGLGPAPALLARGAPSFSASRRPRYSGWWVPRPAPAQSEARGKEGKGKGKEGKDECKNEGKKEGKKEGADMLGADRRFLVVRDVCADEPASSAADLAACDVVAVCLDPASAASVQWVQHTLLPSLPANKPCVLVSVHGGGGEGGGFVLPAPLDKLAVIGARDPLLLEKVYEAGKAR